MNRRSDVLLIDSDEAHCTRLARLLASAGYEVESTPHEAALQRLQQDSLFDAVILCAKPEPSTLSPQDRLGEFVLRYMTHVVPALLARTIVLTTLESGDERFPGACAALAEPVADDELLATLAACASRSGTAS